MIQLENCKFIHLYPRSIATNATASVTWDRVGYDHEFVVAGAGIASSDLTVLTLADGTATNSFTNISSAFTVASANTSSGVVAACSHDISASGRYGRLQIENTSVATVVDGYVILSRAGKSPLTTTDRGVNTFVAV